MINGRLEHFSFFRESPFALPMWVNWHTGQLSVGRGLSDQQNTGIWCRDVVVHNTFLEACTARFHENRWHGPSKCVVSPFIYPLPMGLWAILLCPELKQKIRKEIHEKIDFQLWKYNILSPRKTEIDGQKGCMPEPMFGTCFEYIVEQEANMKNEPKKCQFSPIILRFVYGIVSERVPRVCSKSVDSRSFVSFSLWMHAVVIHTHNVWKGYYVHLFTCSRIERARDDEVITHIIITMWRCGDSLLRGGHTQEARHTEIRKKLKY